MLTVLKSTAVAACETSEKQCRSIKVILVVLVTFFRPKEIKLCLEHSNETKCMLQPR